MSFAIILLLAACSGSTHTPTAPPTADAPEPAPSSVPTPAPAPAPVDEPATVSFEYTPLDLEKCDVIRVYEESGGMEWRCPGHDGTHVFVTEGDLRFDVDFGVPNEAWDSRPGFNTIGSTVEWRLRGGEPFAAILRFKESHPDGSEMDWLGVFKVGTEGRPGCLVEWVGSSAQPSQNEAARTVADTKAVQHTCGA